MHQEQQKKNFIIFGIGKSFFLINSVVYNPIATKLKQKISKF
jgi:hypothetical protein